MLFWAWVLIIAANGLFGYLLMRSHLMLEDRVADIENQRDADAVIDRIQLWQAPRPGPMFDPARNPWAGRRSDGLD